MTMSSLKPVATVGSSKYGNRSKIPDQLLSSFHISDSSKAILAEAGEFSLARSTWSTYNTAAKLQKECEKQLGRNLVYPWSEADTLEFIGWLLSVRKVKSSTVSSYLAGIKQLHVLQGVEPPQLKSTLVKFLLRGQKNKDNIEARKSQKRLPITINMMKLLKGAVKQWEAERVDKLLWWSVCTMAFHGGFRIHEILCRTETEFDPDFTLLAEDVWLTENKDEHRTEKILMVKLKCPKEDRAGKAVIVELHETRGTLCPKKAFEKWRKKGIWETGMPLLRKNDGTPLTGSKLNVWLKDRLGKFVQSTSGKFTYHSFRIGLASTMAASGLDETDIKEAGRWSSMAYETYMKLPQARRANAARLISKLE